MKQASILIVSMWILVILVALAVGVGNKAMLNLQLAKYQRDSIRAHCLARAAVYRAIEALNRDSNSYDAFTEPWADDRRSFEKITLNDIEDQFASVGYLDEANETHYGIRDEERKININKASLEELDQLLIACGAASDARALAQLIIAWRSNQPAQEAKGMCKHAPFSVVEELQPVLAYYFKDDARAQSLYHSLRGLISASSSGRVNINTVSDEVLRIIARALAKEDGLQDTSIADTITQEVIALRKRKGCFTTTDEIDIQVEPGAEQKLLDLLKERKLSVSSHVFLVQATGVAGSTKKTIMMMYNRDQKKEIQWHQN
jgi:type II secretory pathway component PulK